MARLRQQNSQNYVASQNINAEFENVIRYLNSAELGDKTLGELLSTLFTADGIWQGPIELRNDSSNGLQYRVGTYTSTDTGWQNLVTLAELRGAAGSVVSEIGAPILYSRQDTTATSNQTVFSYSFDSSDELLVYVSGVLKVEGATADYQKSSSANTVTFNSGQSAGAVVTIYKIRATAITGFTRSDITTTANQTVFPFVHDENTVLQVYKNGILQRSGGANDYVSSSATDTVTFTSTVASGNVVSIITVESTATNVVTGLMTEANFTDTATGKILYNKLQIADGDITQAKVAGLVAHVATAAKLTVSSSTPSTPASGDLWMDTSATPNKLKFYTGTSWLETAPESSLPTFGASNAGQFVKVNATGTALSYADIDYTAVVPVTQKGAANGVATLDSTGRLPAAQLPTVLASDSIYQKNTGANSNGNTAIKRIYRQKIQVDAISLQCASGTGVVQLTVNGVAVGSTHSVSSSGTETVLSTPQEIDSTSSSKLIGFTITGASSLNDLEVTLAISILSS